MRLTRHAALGSIGLLAVAVTSAAIVIAAVRPHDIPARWISPTPHNVTQYGDIQLDPVTAGTLLPAVPRDEVEQVIAGMGLNLTGVPRIGLWYATREPQEEGGYARRLVWVAVYPGGPAMVFGPPGLSATDRKWMADHLTCEWVVMVDATTAAPVTNIQACRPVQPATTSSD